MVHLYLNATQQHIEEWAINPRNNTDLSQNNYASERSHPRREKSIYCMIPCDINSRKVTLISRDRDHVLGCLGMRVRVKVWENRIEWVKKKRLGVIDIFIILILVMVICICQNLSVCVL